jgi:putative colanic acid biosynthesis acetyltransferase WcaF
MNKPEQPKLQQQHSKSNWPFKIKVLRLLWWPFGIFFLKGTGRIFSPLRILLLKLFGAKIPGKTLVMDGVKVWYPWNLTLMPFSTLGRGVEVYNFASIYIGEQSTVSQDTFLCSATHDYTHPHMPLICKPIIIEDQVWIAARCFIGPGINIKQGCVIGACTVLTKNTDSWGGYAGNPAQRIKDRVIKEE